MSQNEIELFLKARRQLKLERRLLLVCALIALIAGLLALVGVALPYSKSGFLAAVVGGILVKIDLPIWSAVVTKGQLLSLLESQISRDPEAVQYLAKRGPSAAA